MSATTDKVIITDILDPYTQGKLAVYIFPNGNWMAYPLTLCCEASAKGTGEGVCCRNCYELVDESFGCGYYEESQLPQSIRDAVMAVINESK